jgi:hypothetical protein
MEKSKPIEKVKVVVVNPPTKEDAEKRVKKLSAYLSKTWKNTER